MPKLPKIQPPISGIRFRVVVWTAIVTFFVGMLLRRYVPPNIFGEPAEPLTPKTLAQKAAEPAEGKTNA